MMPKEKKTINQYMRIMHRYTGYFIAGMVVIYALSGIVQIYHDTNLLKKDRLVEKSLAPNLKLSELGKALHIKNLTVLKTTADTLRFKEGYYIKSSGQASYIVKELRFPFNRFTDLHTASNRNPVHWFTTVFAVLLLFLAISSFWMFKPKTIYFRRGIIVAGIGLLVAILLLFL
jgi:hypothetical protein